MTVVSMSPTKPPPPNLEGRLDDLLARWNRGVAFYHKKSLEEINDRTWNGYELALRMASVELRRAIQLAREEG